MQHPKFLFSKEAARLLDLTPAAVRLMERRGELPAERVGNVRLFDPDVVKRVARERSQRQASPQHRGRS